MTRSPGPSKAPTCLPQRPHTSIFHVQGDAHAVHFFPAAPTARRFSFAPRDQSYQNTDNLISNENRAFGFRAGSPLYGSPSCPPSDGLGRQSRAESATWEAHSRQALVGMRYVSRSALGIGSKKLPRQLSRTASRHGSRLDLGAWPRTRCLRMTILWWNGK